MAPAAIVAPMSKLYVIAVSTRPGRAGFPISQWIFDRASELQESGAAMMLDALVKWTDALAVMRAS
jgi:hypothetical protein